MGAGGAGLVLSGVTWLIGRGKQSDIEADPRCASLPSCQKPAPGDPLYDQVDSYNAMRTVSTVSFVAGIALGATGVALYLAAPKATAPSASVWIAPNRVGFTARF